MIKIRLQNPEVEISAEDTALIDKSFRLALDRFTHLIREVQVTLLDINGPRGGVDKKCTVQVRLQPRGMLVIRGVKSSFVEAASEASDKVRQIIARRVKKQKTLLHSSAARDMQETNSSLT